MIYFPQNVKTRQVLSPEWTFGHLGRKEATRTLIELNSCYSALESVSIYLGTMLQSHTIKSRHKGIYNVLERCRHLCERMNAQTSKVTYSLENYLKSPTQLWSTQKGFVNESVDQMRMFLKQFPWEELDDLLGRIEEDPEIAVNIQVNTIPRTMQKTLEVVGQFYAPKENRS